MRPCKKHPEKIQYPDENTATQAAARLNILPNHEYKVNSYKCPACPGFHVGRMNQKLNPIPAKDRQRIYNSVRTLLKRAKKIKIPKPPKKTECPNCLNSPTGKHEYVKVPSVDNLFCKYCLKDKE